MADHLRKGLNSISGAWTLWNLRSRCVFCGKPPNLARELLLASEELISGVSVGHEVSITSLPGIEWVLILVLVVFFPFKGHVFLLKILLFCLCVV